MRGRRRTTYRPRLQHAALRGLGIRLGQFNPKAFGVGGSNPFALAAERHQEYLGQRRSVVPYLVNLGSDTPESIAARIDERRKLPFPLRYWQEADWKKMRTDGALPAAGLRMPMTSG